jgi:hypothetical protein
MEVLLQIFPNSVISRNGDIPWPAKSPDLSACDFFLWCYLKGKVWAYTRRPNNVTVLKRQTEEEIQNTLDDVLMADIRDRVEECLRKGGSLLTQCSKNELNICVRKMLLFVPYEC